MKREKSILSYTFLAIVLVILSRIFNFGWFMIYIGVFIVLILCIHTLFQLIAFYRNGKGMKRAKDLSLLSNAFLVFSSFIMPDFGDSGSYAFFGLIKGPSEESKYIAMGCLIIAMVLSFCTVIFAWKRS